MLCRYTAAKKERKVDKYTAGGEIGKRPDHATAVYAEMVKRLWPEMPVIIGGIGPVCVVLSILIIGKIS